MSKEGIAPEDARRKLNLHAQRKRLAESYLPDSAWNVYNSPVSGYDRTFAGVLLPGETIEQMVLGKSDAVVIDLMAPTGTLRDLFKQDPQNRRTGIAVSLEDKRTITQIVQDEVLGITQITGDINKAKVWKDLQKELGGKKADLIVERAVGGLMKVVAHPTYYAVVLQRMWNMLADDGTMLLQLPLGLEQMGIDIDEWCKLLGQKGIQSAHDGDSTLFMRRGRRSPSNLPFSEFRIDHALILRSMGLSEPEIERGMDEEEVRLKSNIKFSIENVKKSNEMYQSLISTKYSSEEK